MWLQKEQGNARIELTLRRAGTLHQGLLSVLSRRATFSDSVRCRSGCSEADASQRPRSSSQFPGPAGLTNHPFFHRSTSDENSALDCCGTHMSIKHSVRPTSRASAPCQYLRPKRCNPSGRRRRFSSGRKETQNLMRSRGMRSGADALNSCQTAIGARTQAFVDALVI